MTAGRAWRAASIPTCRMPIRSPEPSPPTRPTGRGRSSTNKQTFVANDIDGIAAVFADHELIRSLGCESVINVPIVVAGEVLGTINCLHEAGFYTEREGRGGRGAEAARRRLPAAQRTDQARRSMMANRTIRVATDVGGTFTDLVCFETDHGTGESRIITAKSDTTPPEFRAGRAQRAGEGRRRSRRSVDFLAHGTTVVINALTERKGVKVGLITTEGFRDTLEIARGNRPDFFNLHYEKPKPFVPRYLRRELPGPHHLQGRGAEAARPFGPAGDPRRFPRPRASRRSPSASCIPTPIRAMSRRRWPRCRGCGRASRWSPRTRSPANGANMSAPTPPCCRPMCSRSPSAICRACTNGLEEQGLRREPLHHAVELRRRFAGIGFEDPDHHGRIRARPPASGARPSSAS